MPEYGQMLVTTGAFKREETDDELEDRMQREEGA